MEATTGFSSLLSPPSTTASSSSSSTTASSSSSSSSSDNNNNNNNQLRGDEGDNDTSRAHSPTRGLDNGVRLPSPATTTTTVVSGTNTNITTVAIAEEHESVIIVPGGTSNNNAVASCNGSNVNSANGIIVSKGGARLPEENERMSELPEGEDGWRAYYEHPLTAATTAMLNINGAADEQAAGIGLLYEYYKLPPLEKMAPPPPVVNDKLADKYVALPDIWSAVKGGRDALPSGDVELYLSQAQAGGIKREPEDLTSARKSPIVSAKEAKVLLNGAAASATDSSDVHIKQEPPDSPLHEAATRSPNTPVATPVNVVVANVTGSADPTNIDPTGQSRDMAGSVQPFGAQVFSTYDHVSAQYAGLSTAAPQAQFTNVRTPSTTASVYGTTGDYYSDYYPAPAREPYGGGSRQPQPTQSQSSPFPDSQDNSAFVERYMRHGGTNYKGSLTVDLPSPDSGIGEAAITPRDSAGLPQIFDYSDLSQSQMIGSEATRATTAPSSRRPWHDFSRNTDADKVQIAKLYSNVGFRYFLEAPISTSQRREDDRITYINKGQFYGITLEYVPDPEKPLKSQTVKSMIMLMFREEKSPEEEIKAWQFWHSRQHSVKQRILDADTKNSTGLAGCIEEVAHNTIAVYWNPLESPAKINVAVQCLSTDFSNQKGVKGLPLHLQIDTYDDMRDPNSLPTHRGYSQIKVFCDKGAERKTRDEERRAAKRKLSTPGRKKTDEMFHPPCDRTEFYAMSDLLKPPVLFTPTGDMEKVSQPMTSMELNFYSEDTTSLEKKLEPIEPQVDSVFAAPPMKRSKLSPPSDRVMLYVRRDDEDVYNALHLVPPTIGGLATADYGQDGRRDDSSLLQRGHFYY